MAISSLDEPITVMSLDPDQEIHSIPNSKEVRHLARVGNTTSALIDGVDGESMLMNMDVAGFSVSTGAACSSGNPEPSPVLLNMGLSRAQAQSSLRISLGWGNTEVDVERFCNELVRIVERQRGLSQQRLEV